MSRSLLTVLLVAFLASASAYTATPVRASRVVKARSSVQASMPKPAQAALIGAGALALAAAVEPAHAAEFIKSASGSGSQFSEFVIPAGAKANAQGILGPPGAIFALFVAAYTATALNYGPWKDGLPGRKQK
mmetsp:Transcript_19822/g.58507  ORF Transcript_19822/g.58507 Transcript_19822/m.58507 type:complete len:132 (+) Transcript_19822:57-452(+)|eukprot:CAMPEP_0206039826 /NCGR_PEP_ID=MMETSP1466-20131121/5002_1 /ASSEMBLY_ACC=CAM_ASM_001126 /TAXON_ID=44452 /ORGANISM="Pavlova gyrans, Strain CCMP608" /LENGTH=131 /DNA_ID=CAMNT_0053414481 /DNA_START=44 /DNA_END=439 /DNA_ORIENTATION=+